MNERILELAKQCGYWSGQTIEMNDVGIAKFAELIVRECMNQAHGVADLRGVTDDMIYGADTAALRISKHFGVK